jgi:hypothetical protein
VLVAVLWLLSLFLSPTTTEAPASPARVYLTSTAEQLTSLQDQLSERMSQHKLIMNSNLDNFTATLTSLTANADLAVNYAQFIHKIISLGTGGTTKEWQGNAEELIAEAEKLTSITLSDDVRQNVEAIMHIAGTIAAELADLERGGFVERRVFGLESLVCWDESGEMKDVVRELV